MWTKGKTVLASRSLSFLCINTRAQSASLVFLFLYSRPRRGSGYALFVSEKAPLSVPILLCCFPVHCTLLLPCNMCVCVRGCECGCGSVCVCVKYNFRTGLGVTPPHRPDSGHTQLLQQGHTQQPLDGLLSHSRQH